MLVSALWQVWLSMVPREGLFAFIMSVSFHCTWKSYMYFHLIQSNYNTCQLSHLRHESRIWRLKTSILHLLRSTDQFLTPSWKNWAMTALTGAFLKMCKLERMKENKSSRKWWYRNSPIFTGKALATALFLAKRLLGCDRGTLQTSSEIFAISSEVMVMVNGNSLFIYIILYISEIISWLLICLHHLQKSWESWHSQHKNLPPLTQTKVGRYKLPLYSSQHTKPLLSSGDCD